MCQILLMCVYMFSLNAYINSERQVLEKKHKIVCCMCSATQLCPTLCDPVDYSLPDLCPWGFSRQKYWIDLPCLPPGDFSKPGIKPRSPTADSLPSQPPGKLKNAGVVSYPFSRESSQLRHQTRVCCIADGFFTISATREAIDYVFENSCVRCSSLQLMFLTLNSVRWILSQMKKQQFSNLCKLI